jgi:predicted NAD/FAD-binding protein
MKIAIIGGGVSGHAVAWNLKGAGHEIDVYERNGRLGGECSTVQVIVDGEERWADLGVNDFNRRTYRNVVAVMDYIGATYRDLEDTACFYTGEFAYTLDEDSPVPMRDDLRGEFDRFRAGAVDFVENIHAYEGWTVEHYLKEKGFSPDFARMCIYPRVNAMYFVHDKGPDSMPIEAVMHYYVLQEGFGTPEGPERKYFVGGSSAWIEKLGAACDARFIRGIGAIEISAHPDHVDVHLEDMDVDYDKLVFTCHAEDARKSYREGLSERLDRILGSFTYLDSVAVLHTYSDMLPKQHDAWRTYNVSIRGEDAPPGPYSMTYVENRHQNDRQNPDRTADGAEFFTTLNPLVPIPAEHILVDQATGAPATRHFPHSVVNFGALKAQQEVWATQGENNVYFAGGWTLGAGLHEECWEAATRVADLLRDIESDDLHLIHEGPEGKRRAPHYMRQAVGTA